MNFIQSIRVCFSKYFDFSGRAIRSEFWWFQLFMLCGPIVMLTLDALILGFDWEATITPLSFGFDVLTLSPLAAVTARRLHDIGRSGWWQLPIFGFYLVYLDAFIPGFTDSTTFGTVLLIIGIYALGLLVVLIRDSQPQTNRFGPHPKANEQIDVFT